PALLPRRGERQSANNAVAFSPRGGRGWGTRNGALAMPMSTYWKRVRDRVGHDLLLIPSVTAIVHDEQQRILLVRHAEGQVWVTPGGGMEPHESPADAVVRETWEETGLLVEPTHVVGVYGGPEFQVDYANGDQASYLMIVFAC